jgi:hypothetical protein
LVLVVHLEVQSLVVALQMGEAGREEEWALSEPCLFAVFEEAARLAAKDKARKRYVVAANVHQATATDVRHVADVERVCDWLALEI